jgi:hypothetical protein
VQVGRLTSTSRMNVQLYIAGLTKVHSVNPEYGGSKFVGDAGVKVQYTRCKNPEYYNFENIGCESLRTQINSCVSTKPLTYKKMTALLSKFHPFTVNFDS